MAQSDQDMHRLMASPTKIAGNTIAGGSNVTAHLVASGQGSN